MNSSEGVLQDFNVVMGVWVPGSICLIGITGNFISLLVLSRDSSVTLFTLKALACSDLVLLTSALLQQVIPFYCWNNKSVDYFCLNQGYLRVYSWPVVCMAQLNTVWLTVLISAERYIAICLPLNATRLCTISKIRTAVAVTGVLAVLYNIPKFFEFRPVSQYSRELNVTFIVVGSTALRIDHIYRYVYNTVMFGLVLYILPLAILSVLNIRIVRKLRAAKQHWRYLNRTQKLEVQATVLPLVVVLMFLVCGTQSLAVFILDAIFMQTNTWLQVYTAVVNVIVILNSAMNFVIFYSFGKKFRNMFKELLWCPHKMEYFLSKDEISFV